MLSNSELASNGSLRTFRVSLIENADGSRSAYLTGNIFASAILAYRKRAYGNLPDPQATSKSFSLR